MREAALQTAIEQYLALMENMGKLVYIKNNSGCFRNEKGNFYRVGKSGSPDFIVATKVANTLWLEVKLPHTKQNNNQLEFQAKIEKLGHKYYVVRSIDEVVALIEQTHENEIETTHGQS